MRLLYRISDGSDNSVPLIAWRPTGSALAVSGYDSGRGSHCVLLYDRKGDIFDSLDCSAKVIAMCWDREGDVLAVLTENSQMIALWDINTKTADFLDVSMGSREVGICAAWSSISDILAIGTNNGNLFLYNQKRQRKTPLIGKHQRRVCEVAISVEDHVVCISEDNTITVSNIEGETIHTATATDPEQLRVSQATHNGIRECTMSCVTERKVLMIGRMSDLNNTMNLAFQSEYGNIMGHQWYGDGLILVGFQTKIISVSTFSSELGQELFGYDEYKRSLAALTVAVPIGKIITVGDNLIKVRDLENHTDVSFMMEFDGIREVRDVQCSPDYQFVATSALGGVVSVFLTKTVSMGVVYGNTTAILTSLRQITILPEGEKARQVTIEADTEPAMLALGPKHLAVAANNCVWFYDYMMARGDAPLIARQEYLSTVTQVRLNSEYVAVSMDSKVKLHKIVENEDDRAATFPESARNTKLLSCSLTPHFLIFSTESQYIVYFSLEEWAIVSEFRHTSSPRVLCPDPDGLRLCLFDDRLEAYVYSPVDDSLFKLPPVGSTVHYKAALWETFTIDRDTFVVFDNSSIYVFLISRGLLEGDSVTYVGSTKLPFGHEPLQLNKGLVQCLLTNGKIAGLLLDSHMTDTVLEGKSQARINEMLDKALILKRWPYAWRLCEATRDLLAWNRFAHSALENVDVPLAQRIFRAIGDVSMFEALEKLRLVQEKTLLMANVAFLLGKFDRAEELFLKSSEPEQALWLRRYLLHWQRALELSEQLAPKEIPHISKQYAQQLEFQTDYASALAHYERGVLEDDGSEQVQEHNEICRSGEARMCIRTGDIRRGMEMARKLEGRQVKKDCAMVLEQLKQFSEAAELFELGQYYDRAAAVCMKAKAWGKVGELLPNVRSPKIHSQFGRVMEADKKYKQAAVAYRNARDFDNLVRVLLDQLDMAEEAVQVVRHSRSVEGAKLVAKFFAGLGDYGSAIQFLIISQCHQEAWQMAEAYDRFKDYADAIEDSGTPDQFVQLATHFMNSGENFNAGKFLVKAGQYSQALEQLFMAGESDDALRMAIDCVSAAKDKHLTERLGQYLLGEIDGIPKEAKYLFRMFLELGQTREAAKTALVISREEQEKGQYKLARNVLLHMYKDLREKKIKIPQDMESSLMILHSYLLVKALLLRDEPMMAARMLQRVMANMSRFPAHVVPILTSAVVICTKAGLKAAALAAAIQLMTPEYRQKIDAKYKKKIEAIVRKGERTTDPEEPKSPCPFCSFQLPETDLVCSKCKSTIPYCVVTGRHIIREDFAVCPSCLFPGYFSEFRRLLNAELGCPLCESPLKELVPGQANEFFAKDE